MTVTHKRKYLLALLLILALGLFLRLWRLDYGQELPYLAHTDEPTQYNPAIRIIKESDWNPHFFNYPSLTIYIDTLVFYGAYGVGKLTGTYTSLQDLQTIRTAQMAVGRVGNPELLLLGRATTAVMGTATIVLVYALARRLSKRPWAGLLAALVLAISMPHVRLSHYMTVDVIATFFAVACVTGCTLAIGRGQSRYLWLAALCGGLAASSKYNYAVLAVPVTLACLYESSVDWGRRLLRLVACGLVFCLAFVLTSPYILLDWENARQGIERELEHYAQGHLGITGNSFVWYTRYLWRANVFYLLFGLLGLGAALKRRWRAALPLVAATVVYAWLIGRQAVHFDRNVLPVLVWLTAGVGIAADALVAWLPERLRDWQVTLVRWPIRPLPVLLALLALLPSLWVLPPLFTAGGPSGKARAQAWFDRAKADPALNRQLKSLKIGGEAYTVYLDPQVYDSHYQSTVTREEYGLLGYRALGYDLVLLGSGMFARFYENPGVYADEVAVYDAFFNFPNVRAFEGPIDPLEFRDDGGGQVYVVFLSEQGRRFREAMEAGE